MGRTCLWDSPRDRQFTSRSLHELQRPIAGKRCYLHISGRSPLRDILFRPQVSASGRKSEEISSEAAVITDPWRPLGGRLLRNHDPSLFFDRLLHANRIVEA